MKVGDLVLELRVDNKPLGRGLAEAHAGAKKEGERSGKGWADSFRKGMLAGLRRSLLWGVLAPFGAAMAAGAVTVATQFAAHFLMQVVSLLGPGLAAIGALVPATIGAAVLALGALKLALGGVRDALKAGLSGDAAKFAEALKGLSPAAQAVVRDLVGLKDAFHFLKTSVQESFFGSLVGQVRPLVTSYLPLLRIHLMDIAATFGAATRELMSWLRAPAIVKALDGALDALAAAVSNIAEGLPNIAKGLLPLVTVGAAFLPGLTGGFAELTQRFADFMTAAEKSGALEAFISGGLSGLGDLVKLFSELYGVVHVVIGALVDAGLLDALKTLSAAVKQMITAAGPGLKDFVTALGVGLAALGQAAGPVGQALSAIFTALAPLLPVIGNLGAVLLVALADTLRVVAVALGPFIDLWSQLASQVWPMLLPVLATLTQSALPLVTELVVALTQALAPLVPVILDLAKTLIEQLLPFLPQWAEALKPLIPALAHLAVELVPLLVFWIQALIPFIPVLVDNWAHFTRGLIFWAQMMARVIEGAAAAVRAFRQLLSVGAEVGAWLHHVPGMIMDIFSSAGRWLWDAGKRILQGLIDGIKAMAGPLAAVLDWVKAKIPDWKGPLDADRRLLVPAGQAIIGGLMGGIRMQLPGLRGLLGEVTAMAGAAATAGRPAAGGRAGGSDPELLAETRRTNRLLEGLRLTVGPAGLALAVRAGERDLRYTG